MLTFSNYLICLINYGKVFAERKFAIASGVLYLFYDL
jgi:hypothetical protein